MTKYEVGVEKYSTVIVEAENEHQAYMKASDLINGRSGEYCEYANDGWEVCHDLIEELK